MTSTICRNENVPEEKALNSLISIKELRLLDIIGKGMHKLYKIIAYYQELL